MSMSVLDKLSQSGAITLVALLIIFVLLVVLIFIMKNQTRISNIAENETNKVEATNFQNKNIDLIKNVKQEDDLELVAAIMAALSVYTGKDASELRIKSINRVNSTNWTNSAIKSNM